MTEEVRSVSATGGEKGTKLERFDLIPIGPLTQLARHYGEGAKKYDNNQWRKGYEWSKSYAAMMRHATQFWNGEDFDEELGSHHLTAVAWHAFTLLQFFEDFPEYDDRFSTVGIPNSDKDNRWTQEDTEKLPEIMGYGEPHPLLRDVVRYAAESGRDWNNQSPRFFWNALNQFRQNNPGPGYASALIAMNHAWNTDGVYVGGTFDDIPIGSFVWAKQEPYGNVALKINSRDVLAVSGTGNMVQTTFENWHDRNNYAGWTRAFPGYKELV